MILKLNKIYKSYTDTQRSIEVIKGLDLSIDYGETVAIVGPSGAGKSTLLHIIGGIDAPQKGQVLLDGKDLYKMNDQDRSRACNQDIGFIFQFYHLLPELSAIDNVLLPMFIQQQNVDRSPIVWEKGVAALQEVGLVNRMDHKPYQLSGGEQQRVAIARALINRPRLVLCDEPTGNLDSQTGGAIIDLLMALNQKMKQAFIIVTHDLNIAKRCHRMIDMRDGVLHI